MLYVFLFFALAAVLVFLGARQVKAPRRATARLTAIRETAKGVGELKPKTLYKLGCYGHPNRALAYWHGLLNQDRLGNENKDIDVFVVKKQKAAKGGCGRYVCELPSFKNKVVRAIVDESGMFIKTIYGPEYGYRIRCQGGFSKRETELARGRKPKEISLREWELFGKQDELELN